MTEIVDLSQGVEPDDMPLCPLCDHPIMDFEPFTIFCAWSTYALGHVECVAAKREELDL